MKIGFFTSEFALAAASMIAGLLNKKVGLDVDPHVLLGIFATVATYIAQRGWVKAKAASQTSLIGKAPELPPLAAP